MSPTTDASLVDHRGRKYLTAEERQRFLAAVRAHPKPQVQTLARTLALTGCRVREALALRACDVDLDAAEVRFATLKRRREHWRAVPVPEDLVARARPGAPRTARPGEPARAIRGALAGHPPGGAPPSQRADTPRRHRRPPGVPSRTAPQLRCGSRAGRRAVDNDRLSSGTRRRVHDRALHHRDRRRSPRARRADLDLTAPGQKRYISAHFRYAFVWATEIRTSDQVREMRSGDPDRRARPPTSPAPLRPLPDRHRDRR